MLVTHNQRGFINVGVFIALVLGLAVLGGGAYYVMRQSPSQQPQQQNVSASATIDQSSLTTTSTTPTITGTATGDAIFGINVTTDNNQRLYSSKLSVTNGRWSISVSPALLPGTYPVYVYATPLSGDATKNVALTSGVLIVNTAASSGKPTANEISFTTPAGYVVEQEPSYQDAAWHEASGIDKRISITKEQYVKEQQVKIAAGIGTGGSATITIDFNRNSKNLTVQQWLQEKVGCSAQQLTTYSFKDRTGMRCAPSPGQHLYDGIAVQHKGWIVYILNSYDTDSEVKNFNQLLPTITFTK